MATVIGQLHTPYDANNQRDVIHPETQIDAVLDPVTGVPLREQLEDLDDRTQPADAATNKPGLITPEMIVKWDNMLAAGMVVSHIKPASGSMTLWANVYDERTTLVENI